MTTSFRYGNLKKLKRLDNIATRPPRPRDEKEVFTKSVHGKKASDLEERFARALNRYRKSFAFRTPIDTLVSLPGEEKEIDFFVGRQPINIHGDIGHFFTIGQRSRDRIRDLQINETLVPMGFNEIITLTKKELSRQEDADRWVRRNL